MKLRVNLHFWGVVGTVSIIALIIWALIAGISSQYRQTVVVVVESTAIPVTPSPTVIAVQPAVVGKCYILPETQVIEDIYLDPVKNPNGIERVVLATNTKYMVNEEIHRLSFLHTYISVDGA